MPPPPLVLAMSEYELVRLCCCCMSDDCELDSDELNEAKLSDFLAALDAISLLRSSVDLLFETAVVEELTVNSVDLLNLGSTISSASPPYLRRYLPLRHLTVGSEAAFINK